MFTVEIKINGTLIGHVYGHNTGVKDRGETLYDWHYYSTEGGNVVKGKAHHKRENGINALVSEVLQMVWEGECTS